MVKIMIAPNRYIQGPGVTKEMGNYVSHLGSKFFFIGGPTALSIVGTMTSGKSATLQISIEN